MLLSVLRRSFACVSRPAAPVVAMAMLVVAVPGGLRAAMLLPVPQGQGKPADKAGDLDAEREKLRMKDVEAWKKLQVKSLDQVMDVKKATQPLELPASITDADKAKMADLLQKAKDAGGGARTGRALRELEGMGHPALYFLVNALREVDYKDPTDTMFAMQLNQTLQNITLGVNTGFVPADVGEPMDPRKAQWNAMTVQQWQLGVKQQWATKEKFDEYIQKRKAKKDAELDSEMGGGDKPKDGEKGKDGGKPKDAKKDGEKKGG